MTLLMLMEYETTILLQKEHIIISNYKIHVFFSHFLTFLPVCHSSLFPANNQGILCAPGHKQDLVQLADKYVKCLITLLMLMKYEKPILLQKKTTFTPPPT